MKANIETNHGTISVNLLSKDAPITVDNFVSLSKKGFYDGVIFHRVIQNFMIQGGDPTGTGTGGPGYVFEDEITDTQTFNSSGILAMANTGPNTNGSQFFITTVPTPHLNGNHTIWGIVIKGYDVVEKIKDSSQEEKILALEQKLQTKNEVLSELMEEHLKLKKNFG